MMIAEVAIAGLLALNLIVGLVALRRRPAAPAKPGAAAAASGVPQLPPLPLPDAAHLEAYTKEAFEHAIHESTGDFQDNLKVTSIQLNRLIVKLTTEVVERELGHYREELAAARSQALTSVAGMQTAIEQRQKNLEADVDAEMAKYRAHLMAKLDHKLGAAVAAYITESLGQGADLGAQRTFLLESLERNKEIIKADILDEN